MKFLQNLPIPIALTKNDQTILFLNTEFIKVFGYTLEDLPNVASWWTLAYPDEQYRTSVQTEWDQKIKEHKEGDAPFMPMDTVVQCKNGAFKNIEFHFSDLGDEFIVSFHDISERKKLADELIEHKEQLELFIKHSPAALAMLDVHLKYIATSNRWLKDYGLDEQHVIGKAHYDLFPEIGQEWKDIHQYCLKGNIASREEDMFQRADGHIDWLKWEIRPWHKANGDIGGIIMLTEVITERKKAEEKIRESENLFKTITEQAMDGIALADARGNYVFVNESFCNMIRYTEQELLQMNVADLRDLEDKQTSDFDKVIEHKKISLSRKKIRCKDNSIITVDMNGKVIQINNKEFVLGIVSNVTQQVRHEEEIKAAQLRVEESEFRLKLATTSGRIGIWDWDIRQNKLIWDERMYALYGMVKSTLPIHFETWVDCLYADDRQKAIDEVNAALLGISHFNTSFRVKQADGSLKHIKADGLVLKDEQGVAFRMIGMNRDVTERVTTMAQLQEMNIAIAERMKELNCLYRLSEICRKSDYAIDDILTVSISIITKAYQFPEITRVRIVYNDSIFCTPNFETSKWSQSAPILCGKDLVGLVEVYYTQEMPIDYEGPFMKEERMLINSVADILGNAIELKKASYTLQASEEKYRYLFDNNPALIIIWDLETMKVCEVNQQILDLYGYTREEFIGMSVLDYRPQTDHEKIRAFAKSMLEGTVPIAQKNWTHVKKNGQAMIMEITSHKINYQHRKAILSLAKDITEQVKIENELKKSEEKFHALIDHAADAIFMINDSGVIFNVNQQATELFQYERDELIGMSVLALHLEEVRPLVPQIWSQLRIEKSLKDERFLKRKDGTTIEVEVSRKMLPDGSGAIAIVRDVSERNAAMHNIRKSEERIMNIMQNSPVPLALVLSDNSIGFINEQFTLAFGYVLEDVQDINNWWQFAYPDSEYRNHVRDEWLKRITNYTQNNDAFQALEATITCKDGSLRTVEFNYSNLGDDKIISFHDITDRKKMELELIHSEEKHRALIENISDGILLIDQQLLLLYQSPSVQRIVGYTFEDRKNKSITDFIHPEDIPLCMHQYERAQNAPSQPIPIQCRARHKQGHYLWLEVTLINLLEIASVQSYVVIYRDISERKKFEEQLTLFSLIVNSSDDAIISKTNEGIISTWNYGAQKVLGYTAEEAIGNSIYMLIPPECRAEEVAFMTNIQNGKSIDHYETTRIRKDGKSIAVSLTISPIVDETGKVIGASKIMHDISFQKTMEIERTKIMNELIQRNRDLEQFSYIVSHNLRAPVANIMGISDFMLNVALDHDEKEQMNRGLSKSVHALDDVIRDLNHILQTRRTINEQTTIVQFSKLVEDIQMSIANLIEKEKVEFKIDFSAIDEMASIKSYLYSIFYNLVINSIKYKRTELNPIIEIKSARTNQGIEIIFKDNGLGIDLEKKGDQVFGLYKRFHYHTEGKGMGLYMVKTQVETLGGKISIHSQVNKGTEFHIRFEQ